MAQHQRTRIGRVAEGFHGTTAERAEQILTNGFKLQENPSGWLGYGVYFYQDGPEHAFYWAATKWGPSKICVLRAPIDLSYCLDLLDVKGKRQYQAEYLQFVKHVGADGLQQLGQTRDGDRYVDCMVFNLLCTRLREEGYLVTVVRCVFDDGPPVWEDAEGNLVPAGPSVAGHVQLVVRELSAIGKLEVIDDAIA